MRLLRFLGAYLALAAIFAAGMYQVSGFRNYAALAAQGVSSRAVIVGIDCANHGSYHYTFQAQGHWFTAVATDGASKACAELKPSDEVAVTYLSTDPAVSTTGDVRWRRNNEALSCMLVVLLFPAAILLRFELRNRRLRRARPQAGR